jgi:hypothetical protein
MLESFSKARDDDKGATAASLRLSSIFIRLVHVEMGGTMRNGREKNFIIFMNC